MSESNKATREVCDVDIRVLSTKAPFLWFDTANTTTTNIKGDSTYATKKGAKSIAFQNPLEGTMTIEAQVLPFKMYAMLSDGTMHADGVKSVKTTITAAVAGTLTITPGTNEAVQTGTVFVYTEGDFGDETKAIEGTFATNTFTATTPADIVLGDKYDVGYLVAKSAGVNRVSISTSKIPPDYYITMNTYEKGEDAIITPFVITAYKASIQRNLDMSFASSGDPTSVTLTFDLLEDKDGNMIDILEDTDEAE